MVQHQGRGHRGVHRRQVNMNPDILSQIQASNSAANDVSRDDDYEACLWEESHVLWQWKGDCGINT